MCSCLENPRDEGAWWAAIYGVAQSRTRLKWLSSRSTTLALVLTQFVPPAGEGWSLNHKRIRKVPIDLFKISNNIAVDLPYKKCQRESLGLIERTGCNLKPSFKIKWTGEGNGNPLQYSCLENPMDGRAWQAIVHGVAKSWTRLREKNKNKNK